MEAKKFSIESVLSIVTGVPFGPSEDAIKLVNYMHGQTVHFTRLPLAIEQCREKIASAYPTLKEGPALWLQVNQMKGFIPPGSNEDMASIFLRHWLAAMKRMCGEKIELYPLPYKLDFTSPKT
ncbi:MAG: hypothetical protein NTX14_03680 [Candidatus Nealsonbacteria bacterium]|nr:hypothetical protein [Candidatus Nealsonbacteria bacterium]